MTKTDDSKIESTNTSVIKTENTEYLKNTVVNKNRSTSKMPKDTKLPSIMNKEGQKLDISTYISDTEKFRQRPKPKPLRDYSKISKSRERRKKRTTGGPSRKYQKKTQLKYLI
mmetsp:Transcript_29164/g.25797  ORF Transcript_29164/g.25797 Transcript_29164/m.25797 type:complete len:113 (+) Transcript_29164:515-853(+)